MSAPMIIAIINKPSKPAGEPNIAAKNPPKNPPTKPMPAPAKVPSKLYKNHHNNTFLLFISLFF